MLVHIHVNGETISSTPTHPFYVHQFGWILADNLRVGDILVLSNGELVVVEWIQHELLEFPVKVYNFEVEDYHTYLVSESRVLVHNSCGPERVPKNRKEAMNEAKDLAGVPRSQQPSRQWQVGNDITKKGENYKNYEYNSNPGAHGRYYEYDTPNGKRVVVEHTNDGQSHFHAGEPKRGSNPFQFDFKKERYKKIVNPITNDHHFYYN